MSRDPGIPGRHPAPEADRLPTALALFLLFGGALAWWAQLCIGYGLSSWACYPHGVPLETPVVDWSRGVTIALLLACALVAVASAFVSWRIYRRVGPEKEGGPKDLLHKGHGRTRFVAMWGILLGAGFTIATLATLTAFIWVPRCAV